MIIYTLTLLIWFAFDRVKNKIVGRTIHTGIKTIMYLPEWHAQNARFNLIPFLNDWIFL